MQPASLLSACPARLQWLEKSLSMFPDYIPLIVTYLNHLVILSIAS